VELYQAVCIKHGFPLHMHDYYVICFVEQGLQSFSHRKMKHLTPPGGLILLNPGDDHTGEPADDYGFEYRALYPTISHMQEAMFELTGKRQNSPFFPNVRIDDPELTGYLRALHLSLINKATPVELESLFLMVLTKLIIQHAEIHPTIHAPKKEHRAVQQACQYIHNHTPEGITLTELAEYVGLSRYYLLRVFREEIGMPPHAYLESVRISKAKQLLEQGLSLTQVAIELGFSDQSHFTNCFKRFIGVTPGQYAQEIKN
jgi:AraC-like DNA-binding protein